MAVSTTYKEQIEINTDSSLKSVGKSEANAFKESFDKIMQKSFASPAQKSASKVKSIEIKESLKHQAKKVGAQEKPFDNNSVKSDELKDESKIAEKGKGASDEGDKKTLTNQHKKAELKSQAHNDQKIIIDNSEDISDYALNEIPEELANEISVDLESRLNADLNLNLNDNSRDEEESLDAELFSEKQADIIVKEDSNDAAAILEDKDVFVSREIASKDVMLAKKDNEIESEDELEITYVDEELREVVVKTDEDIAEKNEVEEVYQFAAMPAMQIINQTDISNDNQQNFQQSEANLSLTDYSEANISKAPLDPEEMVLQLDKLATSIKKEALNSDKLGDNLVKITNQDNPNSQKNSSILMDNTYYQFLAEEPSDISVQIRAGALDNIQENVRKTDIEENMESVESELTTEFLGADFDDNSGNLGGNAGKQQSSAKTSQVITNLGGEINSANNSKEMVVDFTHITEKTESIPEPAEQLNISLKHAISSGKSELKINLYPRSLGAIEVTIELHKNSSTGESTVNKIKISAESRQSLEMLEKSQAELARALSEVRESKDASLEFNMKEREDSNQHDMHYSNQEEREKWMEKFADASETAVGDVSLDEAELTAGIENNEQKGSYKIGNLNIEV